MTKIGRQKIGAVRYKVRNYTSLLLMRLPWQVRS